MPEEPFLPYGRQCIDEDDKAAVQRVLDSDYLTQGPECARFEKAFAAFVGSRFAVAVSSATAGLTLALAAAGIGRGDEIYTSPNTFAASSNCALALNARPRFVDIEAQTFNLNPARLKKALTSAEKKRNTGKKAVIPVHFAGLACDMERIHRLAKAHDAVVIEDAAHALNATYAYKEKGRVRSARVGACAHSHMAVFSFHPVKHITTGEGGMVTTNDEALYEKLKELRSHGMVKDPERFLRRSKDAPLYYHEMQSLGFNFRLTDIQAALGRSQLKKAGLFVHKRRVIAEEYMKRLADLGLNFQAQPEGYLNAHHLFVVRIPAHFLLHRDQVMARLKRRNIGTQVHYIPVYRHPVYRKLGFTPEDYPETERYYGEALSLPCFPAMTERDVSRVVKALHEILRRRKSHAA